MQRSALLLLLVALAVLSGGGHANAIRRSSSFVAPTRGSAQSLTLTTYLTDAADLHYAAVLSGRAALDAVAIKNAAQQCADVDAAVANPSDQAFVQASTVVVRRAQKVERLLVGLQSNTSYDVYFVAEVPNSNGVYGAVLSVLGTTTHPTPPDVVEVVATAANASATAVTANITVNSPGIIHLAFVPSNADQGLQLSADDVIAHTDHGLAAVFATESRFGWDALSTGSVIEGLRPATVYDVIVVTEALGHGGVYSALHNRERAVQTHASAPNVVDAACSATKGSATSLDISIRLEFMLEELRRATPATLQNFQYELIYDVTTTTHVEPKPAGKRGSFFIGSSSGLEDLLEKASKLAHNHTIEGLDPDSNYDISLVVETVNSKGVVGISRALHLCKTHAIAPTITKAVVQPLNGSVHALQVEIELDRAGNVHYVLASRLESIPLRNSFQQMKNIAGLSALIEDRSSFRLGAVEANEDQSNATAATAFVIEGLQDDTPYSIAMISETIGSFGVFGKPFETLLEASTNENASELAIVAIHPTHGSTSSIDVRLNMTKPTDLLFACWTGNLEEECREVTHDERERATPQSPELLFRIANLTEDTAYEVELFAESRLRNEVKSMRTPVKALRTSRSAPQVIYAEAKPVDSRVDAIQVQIQISEPGIVHYAVAKKQVDEFLENKDDNDPNPSLPVSLIVDEAYHRDEVNNRQTGKYDSSKFPRRHSSRNPTTADRHHQPPAEEVVSRVHILRRDRVLATESHASFIVDKLESNTTFMIHAVTETNLDVDVIAPTGVYGLPTLVNATTYDVAPVIIKASAAAAPARTDGVVITVNVSRPGIIHYQLTDTDFADPATIKRGTHEMKEPHVVRGSFAIEFKDMGLEIKNGTNDTQPMEPLVFANNFTVDTLREATTYHVSLTTETERSNGVFGDFPAPILVTTHEAPPQFVPGSVFVGPIGGSSTSLLIQFLLDKLGDVHYAVFFRGIIRDRTTDSFEEQEQNRLDEQEVAAEAHAKMNAAKNSTDKISEFVRIPKWPPPTSAYDLTELSPLAIKRASLEDLKEGVWENGTISVSRDDVFKKKMTEKKLEKLPPNAVFDVCLAPETSGSEGIFAPLACHRVVTHADYSNQSRMFDIVHVTPVAGTKDAVRIELHVSKLLDASERDDHLESSMPHLQTVTGRVPYFVLIDGRDGRPEFSHNAIAPPQNRRHDQSTSPFKVATPGRGGVVAAGIVDSIIAENESFVAVERVVTGLRDNHPYYFFFAYETAHSDGVFTIVNPHKHRPNDTNSRQSDAQAIEVRTFERAPRMKRLEATPTYGNTSSVTVSMDIESVSQENVILHMVVIEDGCPIFSTDHLLPSPHELVTAEMDGVENTHPCEYPLLYRRVEVNMTERTSNRGSPQHHHHHRHHYGNNDPKVTTIEEVITSDSVLEPNTTYHVLIATETFNSSGVVSEEFESMRVTTFPSAPRFEQLQVQPRKGSTTELVMSFELEHPGEIHYMIGKSGNPELNVTSPYNVSAKSLPGERDNKFHDYGRDVVRLRRTIKVERARQQHVEVIDYLVAGMSYDVFVVTETAGESGVYGDVLTFLGVSTFATPPMLLEHTAYPTAGTVDSLTVGFRVEEAIPCVVHISVMTSSPWEVTSRVAAASDTFGNRLAMEDRFIGQTSVEVDGAAQDWHEVHINVPRPGSNYTVFLVTETRDSDGIFGTVATHHGVRSHREPPVAVNVSVRATDARVDALTVEVGLNHDEGAHIHFAVLRHRQRFSRSAITTLGRIDVVGSNATNFVIEELQGRTAYDVYLRLETLDSGGVVGEWAPFPVTATTHGLPAEVLESVECDVSPTCDNIGRFPCSHVANICGECLDGFDGESGSSNSACRPLEAGEVRPSILISGVRINPQRRRHQQHDDTDSTREGLDSSSPLDGLPAQSESIVEVDDAVVCPIHAKLVGSGHCECEDGYHPVDGEAMTCVPSLANPLLSQSMATRFASRAL